MDKFVWTAGDYDRASPPSQPQVELMAKQQCIAADQQRLKWALGQGERAVSDALKALQELHARGVDLDAAVRAACVGSQASTKVLAHLAFEVSFLMNADTKGHEAREARYKGFAR